MNGTQRYVLDGREIALDQWSKAETANMRPLTETEKAHLRVLLDVPESMDVRP